MSRRHKLTRQQILEWLIYQPASGLFRWRKSPSKYTERLKVAGNVSQHDGYRYIRVCGLQFKAHRLAHFLVTGEWPPVVDHEDNNRDNNRARNLRSTSRMRNTHNTVRSVRNTSGVKGVCWDKRREKWRARLMHFGREINIGFFDSLDEAAEQIAAVRNKLHGAFANHG